MKKVVFFMSIISCLLVFPGEGFAQIDNLTNMSAEWIRMSNRNAATDATDIVVYNPAGLVSLSDGLHLNFSNQFMFRKPEHSFFSPVTGEPVSYKQDSPDWFVPNFYAAYKKGSWSIFGGVYLPGSAGAIDYPDGSITTQELAAGLIGMSGGAFSGVTNEHLKGTSMYLTTSLGGACKLTDVVSVAVAIRNISVSNDIEGGLTLTGAAPNTPISVHVKQGDDGWGGVLGIQVRPDDKLNVALHYETPVKLNLKTDIYHGDNISEAIGLFVDGQRNRRDFPGMVGMGVSYQCTPQFRGEFDANYWFQREANWGKTEDGDDISHLAGDCWSVGVAGVYQVSPKLDVSAGSLATFFRWDDMDEYYESNAGAYEIQYSDNINLGVGLGYLITPGLKFNIGADYTWWKREEIDSGIGPVNLNNSTVILAIGVDYSI
jgi:long-chain fatty acid transport protein